MSEHWAERDYDGRRDEAIMAAFAALPFEKRVLPGMGTVEMDGQEWIVAGDPILTLEGVDLLGNRMTYSGEPFRVVRMDNSIFYGESYPVRLHIRLVEPKSLAGKDAQILFIDEDGTIPAVLLHTNTAIRLIRP